MNTSLFRILSTTDEIDDPRWLKEWRRDAEVWLIEAETREQAIGFIEDPGRRIIGVRRVPASQGVNLKTIDDELSGRYWPNGECGIVAANVVY